MNRKLTREEAITLHREMWADMQANLGDNPDYVERVAFKKKWVEKYFPNEHVNSNCILCEYAEQVTKVSFTRCRNCPIAWNSSIRPCCMPFVWQVCSSANVIDYRYSPISVILALPEREVEEVSKIPVYVCNRKRCVVCYGTLCGRTVDKEFAELDENGDPIIADYYDDEEVEK